LVPNEPNKASTKRKLAVANEVAGRPDGRANPSTTD
jgi:hypothetical protein